MRIKGNKKWDVIVPIAEKAVQSGGGVYTKFKIAGEVDAPTFERAIEQAEHIAAPYVKTYRTEVSDNSSFAEVYDNNGRIWRVQEAKVWAGTTMQKYV